MFDPNTIWSPPPSELRLTASEIHIWKASLLLPDAEYVRLKAFLCEDEIARSEKYLFPHLRDHFIAGRGMLRVLLGLYLDYPPEDLNFGYNDWGKPTLHAASGQDTIQFNLSHSNGVVLFAFQKMEPVGIDVQHLDDAINLLQTGAIVFSPDEMEVLKNLPPENLRTVFYQFWTRKEAYIKGLGKGFSAPLNQIDVRQAPEKPVLHNEHGLPETSDWFVHDFIPCPGYAAAVATKGKDWQFLFYNFEP